MLRKPPADTISFMRESGGGYTSDPNKLDQLMRESWGAVYGNGRPECSDALPGFMGAYGAFLFGACPQALPSLTGEQLMRTARASADTAAGVDGWSPHILKCLPPASFDALARLLTLIEEGEQWPSETRQGRTAIMSKCDQNCESVMSFRLLTILPALYRLWARARLRDLR
eukprot:15485094-Alexandrium_andersonii.AAC.1